VIIFVWEEYNLDKLQDGLLLVRIQTACLPKYDEGFYVSYNLPCPPFDSFSTGCCNAVYRVIHKSLRNFRTRLRNNQDIHGRKEHINR